MTSSPQRPELTGASLLEAVEVMDRLRSPGGCPWDAEQTHASLAPYTIEEAHEVVEAAESGDDAALADELGDLLLQVLFHARVASEREDGFDIDDVARSLVAKLTRRHPHVFGDATAETPAAVNAQWDAIKAEEKHRAHPLDDIPAGLPALARAQKMVSRLRKAGTPSGTRPQNPDDGAAHLGEAILALVVEADAEGIDAEAALRAATRDLERRHRR